MFKIFLISAIICFSFFLCLLLICLAKGLYLFYDVRAVLIDCRMFATKVLFATVKRTTGLVGVPVIPNARAVLIDLYNRTLENVKVCAFASL